MILSKIGIPQALQSRMSFGNKNASALLGPTTAPGDVSVISNEVRKLPKQDGFKIKWNKIKGKESYCKDKEVTIYLFSASRKGKDPQKTVKKDVCKYIEYLKNNNVEHFDFVYQDPHDKKIASDLADELSANEDFSGITFWIEPDMEEKEAIKYFLK